MCSELASHDVSDIEKKRHSAAHILAMAIRDIHPDAKFGIGPAIDDGFYYDVKTEDPITEDELKKIEKKMKKLISQNIDFVKSELSITEARKKFADDGQEYKVEIINDLEAEGEKKDQVLHGILKRIEDLERSSIIDLETGIYTDQYLSQAADNFSAQFHRYDASFGVLGINVALSHIGDPQKQSIIRTLANKLSSSFRGCDQIIFSREEGLFTILLNRVIQQDHMQSIVERVSLGMNDICEKTIPIGAFLMQAGQKEEEKGNVVHTAIRGMRQSLNMWHEGGNVAVLLNGA